MTAGLAIQVKPRFLHPLVLLLLLVSCFSLATILQPKAGALAQQGQSGGVMKILMGDGRKIFAEHFFTQADVTFHSGYYPSIFDHSQAPKNSRHMTSEEGSAEEEEHERQMSFLGPPRDLIERFGRHFMIAEHTHLVKGNEREILPWLKLSAELDPQRIDTYTVTAYWLRVRLGKAAEAEQFLREGLRANPDSHEILFELGRLYSENYQDVARSRNVWELALRRWGEAEAAGKKPDKFVLEEIATNLARIEEQAGSFERAIPYLQLAQKVSPNPDVLGQQIKELQAKIAGKSPAPSAPPR
jgi:tetratricopeptide (TPR) repeat protein